MDTINHFVNQDFFNFVGRDFAFDQPSVNVLEKDDHFVIELAAPGLKKEDFKIALQNQNLTISVNKEQAENTYNRKEFSFQNFKRSFRLPKNVEITQIAATYTDGILYLNLPKKQESKETGEIEIVVN
ncbi:MAG: Hsp20/alpha crystallin family protein [Bacteroidetes bacterium]|nr:MAG: Hsp20/alpha crystallin family protein [Bacteroidota bacterium]